MSFCQLTRWKSTAAVLALALFVIAIPTVLNAQQQDNLPKVEVFLGYQWLNPGGKVPGGTVPNPVDAPLFQQPADATPGSAIPFTPQSLARGFGGSFAYNFTKYWALEADAGTNWSKDMAESTVAVGPKITFRFEGMNLFIHTLFGLNRLNAKTSGEAAHNGVGAVLGGGMDLPLTKKLTWRLFEADYVWTHSNFADVVGPDQPDLRRPSFNGARLRTGVVLNFGGAPAIPPTAACTIDKNEVLVGEPLHVTVAPSNFNPKHTLTYAWSSTGAKIEGKDTGAAIDTNGAAPGSYTATAKVSDPKVKKGGEASCTSNFTVKPLNPPQISCSVNPTTVELGTPSSVTCTCTSPDNVPVTMGGWTSSSGSIAGSGNNATLTTTGASAGTATVNATCTDSRGLTASTSNSVTLKNPPPPPPVVDKVLEARLALHSVYFPTAKPPEKDPMAGLVESQQQTLVTLATDFKKYREAKPDAHLILEGHADVRGSAAYNQALSERRVARVKGFLVENGVPEANIETKALGAQHNLTAEEVKASLDQNTELTPGERKRVVRNMKTIIWASNRRVDITLNTAGQNTETSVRQYPFNATDSLTLIGGREAVKKAPAEKKAPAAKSAKKPAKK